MKKTPNNIHRLLLLGIAASWAFLSFGVASALEYQPLVPIPGVTGGGDFSQYFNSLFNIAVLVGSVLAVLAIALAGTQYMTTDAVLQKKDSVKRIQMILTGLLMLLATFLFFNQINPRILDLKLELPEVQGTGSSSNTNIGGTRAANNVSSLDTSSGGTQVAQFSVGDKVFINDPGTAPGIFPGTDLPDGPFHNRVGVVKQIVFRFGKPTYIILFEDGQTSTFGDRLVEPVGLENLSS